MRGNEPSEDQPITTTTRASGGVLRVCARFNRRAKGAFNTTPAVHTSSGADGDNDKCARAPTLPLRGVEIRGADSTKVPAVMHQNRTGKRWMRRLSDVTVITDASAAKTVAQ